MKQSLENWINIDPSLITHLSEYYEEMLRTLDLDNSKHYLTEYNFVKVVFGIMCEMFI